MKLAGKIVLQNVIGITTVGAVSLLAALISIHHGFDAQVKGELAMLSTNVQEELDQRLGRAVSVAQLLAENGDLARAIDGKDASLVRKLAQRGMERGGMTVVTISDNAGRVLARGHSEKSGDDVSNQENVRRGLKGETTWGLENGTQTKLALRAGAPACLGDKIVGCVTTGVGLADTEAFVDGIKSRYGVECTIFDQDTRASTTILKEGKRAVGTRMDNAAVLECVLKKGQTFMARNAILGQNYDTVYLPLKDRAGNVLGMVFIGRPRAQVEAMVLGIVKWSLITNIVICLIAAGVAVITTRRLGASLRHVVTLVHSGTEQVSGASAEISRSSQCLAEDASEQAASIEETSSSLEEMSSMTRQSAENAHKTAELARAARTAADRGAADMERMNTAIGAIKSSSDDVAKIIKTIDEIAFQTNILALNAAVEAARAGEAGMGFAVVAEEVRSLAQRSAQAAKETSSRIEGAIQSTAQGVEISQMVSSGLQQIVSSVHEVDKLVAQMVSAAEEQSRGISQINTAVGQMDKVTQNVAAQAEESSAASGELASQAVTLRQAAMELQGLVDGIKHASENNSPAAAPVTTAPTSRQGLNRQLAS
jgi:methyl-accepting chemotaxis protein